MTQQPETRKKRALAALVALGVVVVTVIALVVMLTLQVTGQAAFAWSIWLVIVFGAVIAVMLTGLIATSKRRSRARNITGHPATSAARITLTERERERFRNLRDDIETINTKENK